MALESGFKVRYSSGNGHQWDFHHPNLAELLPTSIFACSSIYLAGDVDVSGWLILKIATL